MLLKIRVFLTPILMQYVSQQVRQFRLGLDFNEQLLGEETDRQTKTERLRDTERYRDRETETERQRREEEEEEEISLPGPCQSELTKVTTDQSLRLDKSDKKHASR